MSDLISREETIKAFAPYAEYESNRTNEDWVARIITILNNMPSIDTEERKKGAWVVDHDYTFLMFPVYCSNCHRHGKPTDNYCPNCGSRMVVKNEQKHV